jgi:hypothetical protein
MRWHANLTLSLTPIADNILIAVVSWQKFVFSLPYPYNFSKLNHLVFDSYHTLLALHFRKLSFFFKSYFPCLFDRRPVLLQERWVTL